MERSARMASINAISSGVRLPPLENLMIRSMREAREVTVVPLVVSFDSALPKQCQATFTRETAQLSGRSAEKKFLVQSRTAWA